MSNSRVISTRMAITGHSEYTAALKNINAELRSVQSSLKLVESSYAGNANSLAALTDKERALQDVLNVQSQKLAVSNDGLNAAKTAAEGYRQQIEQTKAAIAANATALETARAKYGDNSQQVKDLTDKDKELNAQLQTQQNYLAAAEKGVSDWQTKVNDAQVAVNGTTAAIEKNNQYLDEAKNSADGCAKSIDNFGKESATAKDPFESLLGNMKSGDEIIVGLLSSITALAGVQGIKMLANAVKECAEASIDFEASMASVRRTTGMSEEEIAILGDQFKQLSVELPITTDGLAAIATTAGQLGVSKEYIGEFTETIAKLSVVTGQSADEVATNLARIRNLTSMDEGDYDRLASTIAAMGDASATTAQRIEENMERIAAIATVAGFSVPEITAISTAFSSAGVESSRAGTAFTNTLSDIQTAIASGRSDIQKFADLAGMSAGEFTAAWKSDPMTALIALTDGIRNANDQFAAMATIGITDARQQQSWSSLVNSAYDLEMALSAANIAWEENTALSDKAGIEANTMAADIQKLKNAFEELRANLGDLFTPAVDKFVVGITKIVDTVADGVKAVDTFIDEHEALKTVLETGFKTAALDSLGSIFGFNFLGSQVMGAKFGYENIWGNLFRGSDEAVEGAENVAEAVEAVDAATSNAAESTDKYADAIEKAKGNTEEYTGSMWDAVYALQDLGAKFTETYEATLDSFSTSPFETWRMSEDELAELVPLSEVMDNWIADAEAKSQYAANMVYLASQGLSSDLLSWLDEADQSTAAAYVAEIAAAVSAAGEGTDAAAAIIAEANEKYAEAAEADKQAAIDATVAKMDLADEIAAIEQLFIDGGGTQEQFQAWFYETFSSENLDVDSVISSLEGAVNSGLGNVEVSTEGVTADVSTLVDALGAGGTQAAGAFEEGVGSISGTAEEALSVTQSTGEEIVESVNSTLSDVKVSTAKELSNLRSIIKASTSGYSSDLYNTGYQMVNGMISGINARSSALFATVSAVVKYAIDTANAAAQIKSPSRETMKTGKYFVQGIEVGIEDEAQNLYDVVSEVMKTAADVDTMMDGIDIETPDLRSEMLSQNIVEHTGTIRVEGVNNRGELIDTVSILVNQMKQEARLR